MISDTTKAKIAQFGCAMLEQLGRNEHKGDWERWTPEDTELMREIRNHIDALDRALLTRDGDAIAKHSTAIANFCMKTVEVYGS